MCKLTRESTDEDFERARRRWTYFKREVTRGGSQPGSEPGEARKVISEIFQDSAWKNFAAVRHWRYQHSQKFLEKRREYYREKIKDARSTPEARARLAEARRRQRVAKSAQDEKSRS
jgi:hypothetical protein